MVSKLILVDHQHLNVLFYIIDEMVNIKLQCHLKIDACDM